MTMVSLPCLITLWICGSVALAAAQGPGQPLFLSKYLPSQPDVARKLSTVEVIANYNYTSYSGFFTVNETLNSNMYFWFFPSQEGQDRDRMNPDKSGKSYSTKSPLLMWLQGGPGGSSLFGLFAENGPFSAAADGKTLVPNPYTWNKKYSMLYVDNPVGTGFSFTNSVEGFSHDENEVSNNLYSVLVQFFEVFYDYKSAPFYITGESYAGKYVPSIAHKVHVMNNKSPTKINMKGIAIGDGVMDPINQFTGFSEFFFYLGLADEEEAIRIKQYEEKFTEEIAATEWVKAFRTFDEMMNGDFYHYPTYFYNVTGLQDYFNLLQPSYPANPFDKFVNLDSTRAAIHVGSVPYFSGNDTVELHLISDWAKSVSPVIPTLLDNYKVMFYNGQLDLILGPALAEKYYRNIQWKGQQDYRKAKKIIWKNKNNSDPSTQLAGYVRSVRNFRQVVVRNAGHLLPLDQPANALDMITRFIDNIPFDQ